MPHKRINSMLLTSIDVIFNDFPEIQMQPDKNPTDSCQVFKKFISEDFDVPNCTTFPPAFPYPPLHLDHFVRLRHSEHQQFIRLLWIRKLWKLDAKHLKSIIFHSHTLMMLFKSPKYQHKKWDQTTRPSNMIFLRVWSNDRSCPSDFCYGKTENKQIWGGILEIQRSQVSRFRTEQWYSTNLMLIQSTPIKIIRKKSKRPY